MLIKFENLVPSATKSKRHSKEGFKFIEIETRRLLEDGIIEANRSN